MVTAVYTFRGKESTYRLPESYNQLSGKQLIGLAPILAQRGDPLLAALQALRVLLGYSRLRFVFLPVDTTQRLLEHINWLFEDNTLTSQLIPTYRGFYGPKAEFDNLTLDEYHCTEIYYDMLRQKLDPKALDALVAVLYRKAKSRYNHKRDPDGDPRRCFNANEIEYWAGKVASWPLTVKQAILLWYDGCRQHLIKLYPKVYASGGQQSAPDEKGMFGVIRGLSDGGKYGTFEQVKKLNIHIAHLEMEKLIDELEELKKQETK